MKAISRVCLAGLLVVMVLSACAPATTPTPESAPTAENQPPVIDSVTPAPAEIQWGEVSTVRCAASDPDGDELSYTWSATGGTFLISGGNYTIWKPLHDGDFTISVTVDDGRGGIATESCTIRAWPLVRNSCEFGIG